MSEPEMPSLEEARELCMQAFEKWGVRTQMMVGMEELSEMAVAISHFARKRQGAGVALAEEIADVELVCLSMRVLLGEEYGVDAIKAQKWARLKRRLNPELPED